MSSVALEHYKETLENAIGNLQKAKKWTEMSFGERLKWRRLSLTGASGKLLSPELVGEKLGVSGQTVRNWESGATEPALAMIVKIAKLLRVRAGFLAFGERPNDADARFAPAEDAPALIEVGLEEDDKRAKRGRG